MKKVLVFLLSFLVGICLFFWVMDRVGWAATKEILFTFSIWKIIVILGITLLIWLSEILKYTLIFKSQRNNFHIWNLGEIIFASLAITYLFPTSYFGGETFKAYSFKRSFSLPWEKNISAVLIEKFLSVSVVILFLVIGAISFLFLSNLPLKTFLIIAIFLGFSILVLVAFYFKCFKKESILKWFFKIFGIKNLKNHLASDIEKKVYHFFDFKKIVMWKGLGIAFFKNFLVLARCYFLIFFLKGEVNIFVALAILFFTHLSYFFPFPARVGSSEVAQAFAFSSLGLGAASGITFSFILRVAEILIASLGLILLLKLGLKFLSKKELNKLVHRSPAR